MRLGKLSSVELNDSVLSKLKKRAPQVISGAALSEDSALFKTEKTAVISCDPITGETDRIGSLAIKVASNDVYAAGGKPFLATFVLLAPTGATTSEIAEIMTDADNAAAELNVEIAAGHTEFTDAVTRFVAVVTVIGETDKPVRATTAKAGDTMFVTDYLAKEGTAVLAYANKDELKSTLSAEVLNYALSLADNTSVSEVSLLAAASEVNAMHDVTEGGIFGAVSEFTEAAGVGAVIRAEKLPYLPVTDKVCAALGADKNRLVSSGSLLISTDKPQKLIKAFEAAGKMLTEIGVVTKEKGAYCVKNGEAFSINVTPDEMYVRK